jgi:hypothetical protein
MKKDALIGIKHLCHETGASEKIMRKWLRRRGWRREKYPWLFTPSEAAQIIADHKAALAKWGGRR